MKSRWEMSKDHPIKRTAEPMHAGVFGQHPESKFEQSRLNPQLSLCCVLYSQDNLLSNLMLGKRKEEEEEEEVTWSSILSILVA